MAALKAVGLIPTVYVHDIFACQFPERFHYRTFSGNNTTQTEATTLKPERVCRNAGVIWGSVKTHSNTGL